MKKMYIKPVIKEFQIVAQQTLMQASGGETVTVSSEKNYEEGSMTDLSRRGRGGFFDDEEE